MSNILLRGLTGTIFVALIIGALWFGIEATLAVMSIFLILGLFEFFNLFKNNSIIQISIPLSVSGILLIYILLTGSILGLISFGYLFCVLPVFLLLILTELWRKKEQPLVNIGIISFSIFYLVIPFTLVIFLNLKSDHQDPLAIAMFLLIWTNDTFAYLTGRILGKTKLFERISPKKTWEGTIGGIFFTILTGYFISLYSTNYPLEFWIVSALIIAPCAIFGDLLESLFKRSLNIKDSGTILPGHGGILDRFDATLFAAPFFYSWLMIYAYF